MKESERKCWLGVASLEHVDSAVEKGICQFSHGKMSAVKNISPGDWIVYYSPKDKMAGGATVQAFTAIGQIEEGEIRSSEREVGIHYRRSVNYCASAKHTEVRPLLSKLSFVKNPDRWGLAFRLSKREISPSDFAIVAEAMGIDIPIQENDSQHLQQ